MIFDRNWMIEFSFFRFSGRWSPRLNISLLQGVYVNNSLANIYFELVLSYSSKVISRQVIGKGQNGSVSRSQMEHLNVNHKSVIYHAKCTRFPTIRSALKREQELKFHLLDIKRIPLRWWSAIFFLTWHHHVTEGFAGIQFPLVGIKFVSS